ncbi:MAG: peptidylprolyl isomerase [Dysgonomonas sp.]
MTKILSKFFLALLFFSCGTSLMAQDNVIDQIIWVVGDEAILKSEVEGVKLNMLMSGEKFEGDPDCLIPEQIAVQKLFLHQAKIDSIEVGNSEVTRMLDYQINRYISTYGSKEKLEEYSGKTVSQLREDLRERVRDNAIAERVRDNIVGDVKLTPSEVKKYYMQIPQDSLPFIPTTVESQIITLQPVIPLTEIDAVKNRLREFTDRINKGNASFAALALLYSEDTESAKKGGELDFMTRTQLVPEFASVAFSLTDPTKVSNIVESEYGYHIIQLVERRGDRVKVRHILLKPKVPQEEINKTMLKLDSISTDIKTGKFTFEDAALYLSSDKDTRNSKGLMVNKNPYSFNSGTAKFAMSELPAEAAKVIDTLKVDQISKPFVMINNKGKEVVAIVKLKQRVEQHKANITEDYQAMRSLVESEKKEELLKNWVQEKIKNTYIRVNSDWLNCDFQYSGWVKNNN